MIFGGYSYKNSKGEVWYLHMTRGRNGVPIYYFSRDPVDAVPLPSGYVVVENPRTGVPFLKKLK